MRFFHISDIHLGKKLNDTDLLDEQKYFLEQFLNAVRVQKPDAVVIAGDVYDRSVPSADAVTVLDGFLTKLAEMHVCTMLISGNHDSAERLNFVSGLLESSGIHISAVQGQIKRVTLTDEHGEVNFYLMPFSRPSSIKNEDEDTAQDYDAMARDMIAQAGVNYSARNVLVSHQLYVRAGGEVERSDSEIVSIGGTDSIDTAVIDGFDYAALGHLHRLQKTGDGNAMYCGSPIKYSLSEYNYEKCWLDVTLGRKGEVYVAKVPIKANRDLRRIKGKLEDLLAAEQYSEDLIWAVLTDETPAVEALARLRAVYPNTLHLEYEMRTARHKADTREIKNKSSAELFGEFYKYMLGKDMDDAQAEYVARLIDALNGEGEHETD